MFHPSLLHAGLPFILPCWLLQVSQEMLDRTFTQHWNCKLNLAGKAEHMAKLLNSTLIAI